MSSRATFSPRPPSLPPPLLDAWSAWVREHLRLFEYPRHSIDSLWHVCAIQDARSEQEDGQRGLTRAAAS